MRDLMSGEVVVREQSLVNRDEIERFVGGTSGKRRLPEGAQAIVDVTHLWRTALLVVADDSPTGVDDVASVQQILIPVDRHQATPSAREKCPFDRGVVAFQI